ncbi:hypothetical protein AB0J35_43760 [Nonomuraea angiospora]|uniref:hypothetical protein n=1 Tax=Nonomuraea angiospora TaxID=46172 RepID=UPI00343CAC16
MLNGIAITRPEHHVAFDKVKEEDLTVPAGGGNIAIKVAALSPWPIGGSSKEVKTTLELGSSGTIGPFYISGNQWALEASKRIAANTGNFPEEIDDRAEPSTLDGAIFVQALMRRRDVAIYSQIYALRH